MNKREKILTLARELPLFSTEQAARYFSENGSPSKRASEVLTTLEREKWIEGKRREIGKTKVWRLSSTGRQRLGIKRPPVPFNTPKVEHILGVGSIFQELLDSGRLQFFLYEPKDEFFSGRRKVYAPDAFFYLQGAGAYLLEYQRSPLSSNRWAAKWAVASEFFDGGHYKKASWQRGKIVVKPKILVIAEQSPEQVQAESTLELLVNKSIKNFV